MRVLVCGSEYGSSLTPIEPPDDENEQFEVKLIACGFDHVMIVTQDNDIYSIGLNHAGQLAIGDSNVKSDYKTFQKVVSYPFKNQCVKLLACGYSHNVIVTESDEIWVSGSNQYGGLGLGHTTSCNKFVKVPQFTSNSITMLSCGGYHTTLVTEKNEIWTCGHNNRGQLAHGDVVDRSLFKRVDTQGSFRDRLFFVGTLHGKAIKQIACGGSHTVVLTVDYGLWACGSNRYGQLGVGYSKFYFNSLVFQQIHSSVPKNLKNKTIKQIACGVEHTYLITESGHLFSSGYNQYGQLSLSHNNDTNTFTESENTWIIEKLAVSSPSQSTVMLTSEGELLSSGFNGHGQCGLEDRRNRSALSKAVMDDVSGDEEIVGLAHGARQTAVVVATRTELKKKMSMDTMKKNHTGALYEVTLKSENEDDDKQAILQELKQQEQTNIRLKQWNQQLLAVLKQNLRQWKVPPSQIQLDQKINDGAFGRVYRGTMTKNETITEVAIKEFYLEVVDWNAGIATEIGILANLDHPNCVKFYGFTEDTDKIQIITEFMESNLFNLLHNSDVELTARSKIHIALEIANGLKYLHTQDPIVLHMDIKADNILVNNDGQVVKIADFGLSELSSCSLVEMGALGTAEYISPEAIVGRRAPQCDVYSYGILLYEIWFRRRPYAELDLMKHDLMHQVLTNHTRPQIPEAVERGMEASNKRMIELMSKCWSPFANQRPSLLDIITTLEKASQELVQPT